MGRGLGACELMDGGQGGGEGTGEEGQLTGEGRVGSLPPPLPSCLSLLRLPASDTPGPGPLRHGCFRKGRQEVHTAHKKAEAWTNQKPKKKKKKTQNKPIETGVRAGARRPRGDWYGWFPPAVSSAHSRVTVPLLAVLPPPVDPPLSWALPLTPHSAPPEPALGAQTCWARPGPARVPAP